MKFKPTIRYLLSLIVIVVITLTTGMAQQSRFLRFDAKTTQKLQSLFDEDSLACFHRAHLQQEEKQLSDRSKSYSRIPQPQSILSLARFSLTVLALAPTERPSKYSRAPPLSMKRPA